MAPTGWQGSYHGGELVFPGPADGADPIGREIFKRRVGGNIRLRVSVSRFVEITANSAQIAVPAWLLQPNFSQPPFLMWASRSASASFLMR